MKSELDKIILQINKKYDGLQVIGRTKDFKTLDIERLPTQIKVLDTALGGGLPKGRIIELYGLPSSGKTLISLVAIREAQKQGLDCVYIDVENAFDPEWAKKIGVDVDNLVVANLEVGEDIMELIFKLLEASPGIIVVDSVASMIPSVEMEKDLVDPTVGLKARLLSRGIPKLLALNKKTMVIFINQIRMNVGAYGNPTTTPGGNAIPHYASIRVEVSKGDFILEGNNISSTYTKQSKKQVIGQVVNFYVKKNKTAPPFRRGSFKYYYDDCSLK